MIDQNSNDGNQMFLGIKSWMVCGLIAVGGLVGSVAPVFAQSDVQKRVLAFAESKKGARVDPGECTDLVNAALEAAGALPGDFSATSYRWGTQVANFGKQQPKEARRADAYAGAIIQFENVVLQKGNATWYLGIPHHTAIIKSSNGSRVTLIHQNVGGNSDKRDANGNILSSKVREQTIDLAGIVSGSYAVYRPERRR